MVSDPSMHVQVCLCSTCVKLKSNDRHKGEGEREREGGGSDLYATLPLIFQMASLPSNLLSQTSLPTHSSLSPTLRRGSGCLL